MLVPQNSLHGPVSDIVGISVRGEFTIVQPLDKIVHDVGRIRFSKSQKALQQSDRQAAVVCPGSGRQVEGSVSAHFRYRIAGNFFS